MPTSHSPKAATESSVLLNLRIKPSARNLIDRAAELTGKTRTDFVLEASQRAAEEALLDRTVFSATPETYAAFLARLEAPLQQNEKLRRTMTSKAPWDDV